MAQHTKLSGLMGPQEKVVRVATVSNAEIRRRLTSKAGSVYIPNGDGTGTMIGPLAGTDETGAPIGMDQFVYDTTPPGAPTGVTWSTGQGNIVGYWDGSLTGGVPADFSYVEFRLVKQSEQATDEDADAAAQADDEAVPTMAGRLKVAGSAAFKKLTRGETYDCYAVAVDVQGNESDESEHTSVTVVDEVARVAEDADALREELDAANQRITQTANDLEGVKTTATNAAEKGEAALKVATEAEQTATSVKTTATEAYTNANDALTRLSSVEQTATSLTTQVASTTTTANEALAKSTTLEQTSNDLTLKFNEAYNTMQNISDAISADGVPYIRMGTTEEVNEETGETETVPCLFLGKDGSALQLMITNQSINFMQGDDRTAYILGNLFHIANGVLTDELHLGGDDETGTSWVWKKRANEHLGLRYSRTYGTSTTAL